MWVLGGYKNVVDDFRRTEGRLLMRQESTGSKRSSADVFVSFESDKQSYALLLPYAGNGHPIKN